MKKIALLLLVFILMFNTVVAEECSNTVVWLTHEQPYMWQNHEIEVLGSDSDATKCGIYVDNELYWINDQDTEEFPDFTLKILDAISVFTEEDELISEGYWECSMVVEGGFHKFESTNEGEQWIVNGNTISVVNVGNDYTKCGVSVNGIVHWIDEGDTEEEEDMIFNIASVSGYDPVYNPSYDADVCEVELIPSTGCSTCTDTDGGIDSENQGTASDDTLTKTDYCSMESDVELVEWFCGEEDSVEWTIVTCDTHCYQGECVDSVLSYCKDTDGGENSFVKGTVNSDYGDFTDDCSTINGVHLYAENFCNEFGRPDTKTALCPEGYVCGDGACKSDTVEVCTDSDGPKNFYEKGKAYGTNSCSASCGPNIPGTGIKQHWEDYCIDANNVYDFSCSIEVNPGNNPDPLSVWSDMYYCQNGCNNGACIPDIDLELKSIKDTGDTVSMTICSHGDYSLKDFSSKFPSLGINGLPWKYNVYDENGIEYHHVTKASDGLYYLKEGNCITAPFYLQDSYKPIYEKNKKITIELDPDNIIKETNENNNKLTALTSEEESCIDLAYNKPTIHGSYYNNPKFTDGGKSHNAVDHDDTTKWRAGASTGAWMYVDLGSTKTFNQVKIKWSWDKNFGDKATSLIQVSNDATNWETVSTLTHTENTKNEFQEIEFSKKNARYVKFYAKQWNGGWGTVSSLEVYHNCDDLNPNKKTCEDSDGGKDYYKAGSVTSCTYSSNSGGCGNIKDHCLSKTQLQEMYCDGSEAKSVIHNCACDDNLDACIQNSKMKVIYPNGGEVWNVDHDLKMSWSPSNVQNAKIPKVDLYVIDMNGKNAITPSIGRTNTGWDTWTPRGIEGKYKIKVCESGTTNCDTSDDYFIIKKDNCVDTDHGKNYDTYGEVITAPYFTATNTHKDQCKSFQGTSLIKEWYCEEDRAKYTEIPCPYGCNDGACNQQNKPDIKITGLDVSELQLAKLQSNEKAFKVTPKLDHKNLKSRTQFYYKVVLTDLNGKTIDNCEQLVTYDGHELFIANCALDGEFETGYHIFTVSVDNRNEIAESSERNNMYEYRIYIRVNPTDPPEPPIVCPDGDVKYYQCPNGNTVPICECDSENGDCDDNLNELCDSEINQCNGCETGNSCVPYGTRINDDGFPKFCFIDGKFEHQLNEGLACQNNYECRSNSCLSGKCTDIKEQLNDTNNLLQKLLNWLSHIFG